MRIDGLEGNYCSDCVHHMMRFKLAPGTIIPMCRPCLNQLIDRHDLQRIERMVKEAEMQQEIGENHKLDADGNPAGGITTGVGFVIAWQDGPLGRGADRKPANGAFVEGIISAAIGRLEFYQTASDGRFACDENVKAIAHLKIALQSCNSRTAKREERQVEGTHAA